jgi:hypothetical protein
LRFLTISFKIILRFRTPEQLLNLALFATKRLATKNQHVADKFNQIRLNYRIRAIESFGEL